METNSILIASSYVGGGSKGLYEHNGGANLDWVVPRAMAAVFIVISEGKWTGDSWDIAEAVDRPENGLMGPPWDICSVEQFSRFSRYEGRLVSVGPWDIAADGETLNHGYEKSMGASGFWSVEKFPLFRLDGLTVHGFWSDLFPMSVRPKNGRIGPLRSWFVE